MRLDAVLSKIVDEAGRVHYGDMDEEHMSEVLEDVEGTSTRGMTRDQRYAFLLNAYNAWALALAHRQLDAKGLGRPWRWLRFFVLSPIRVAGRRTNLLLLEFLQLRPHLKRDPRGHFALVCASSGCPPLRGGQYHGETLDEELEAAGRAFLSSGTGYLIDRRRRIVWTNRILKWYRRDFHAMGGVRKVLEHYASRNDAEWMQAEEPRIRFQRYDWRRNDA